MLSPLIALSTQQAPTASLRLQQSVKLLQMSSQDFLESISNAIQENPFLESDGDEPLPSPLQAISAELAPTAQPSETAALDTLHDEMGSETAAMDSDAAVQDFTATETPDGADGASDGPIDGTRDDWLGTGSGNLGDEGEFDRRTAPETLAAHLQAQLRLLRLSERELALASFITELLEEDGYLRCDPLEELSGLDPDMAAEIDPQELEIAVRRVQSLEPLGVGARSVQECLSLQLGEIQCPRQQAVARKIVDNHLALLAKRDLPEIARLTGESAALVEQACKRLRTLEPRPGWRHAHAPAHFIVPDIIVQRREGRWQVVLNPSVVPRVRLNRQIMELYRGCKERGERGLATHLQEARWTLRNVEQRFCTIVQVARAVVERQQRFFDFGALALKPLSLREIAQAVGVHESTVSRVTSNKYLASPSGVFEIKHFFSRAVVMPSGRAFSAKAIRSLLSEMIAAEAPGKALTDAMLAERLRAQGFHLARRTITKYRQALKIETAVQRRAPWPTGAAPAEQGDAG